MQTLTFPSPLGHITIRGSDGAITGLEFARKKVTGAPSPLLEACAREIGEYLAGKRSTFDVPVRIEGTAFDLAVLNAMRKITFGKTASYAALAKAIGKPKAYRAVANACGRNKVPILIPCHRIVASDGLGGFSAGIRRKKSLLRLERVI